MNSIDDEYSEITGIAEETADDTDDQYYVIKEKGSDEYNKIVFNKKSIPKDLTYGHKGNKLDTTYNHTGEQLSFNSYTGVCGHIETVPHDKCLASTLLNDNYMHLQCNTLTKQTDTHEENILDLDSGINWIPDISSTEPIWPVPNLRNNAELSVCDKQHDIRENGNAYFVLEKSESVTKSKTKSNLPSDSALEQEITPENNGEGGSSVLTAIDNNATAHLKPASSTPYDESDHTYFQDCQLADTAYSAHEYLPVVNSSQCVAETLADETHEYFVLENQAETLDKQTS